MTFKEIKAKQLQLTVQKTSQSDPRRTSRQWIILIIFCAMNVCAYICSSLHPLLLTRLLKTLGARQMFFYGNILVSGCYIMFGFLDRVPSGVPFISLTFSIRIVEALGNSAYFTTMYAIIAREFPDSIGATFSQLEVFCAIGMMIGNIIGGFLYEIGGYLTAFSAPGILLLLSTLTTAWFFPSIDDPQGRPSSLMKLLKIPAISVSYYSLMAVTFSFNLSPTVTGLIFMVTGIAYAISAPLWSIMAAKCLNTKIICAIGGATTAISFILIGPAPFIPIKPELWLLIVSLAFHGLGVGAEFVAIYLEFNKEAIANGFPNNIETYGLISGLWMSGSSFGRLLGPSVSGVLYDSIGFSNTTLLIVLMHTLVVLLSIASYKLSSKQYKEIIN